MFNTHQPNHANTGTNALSLENDVYVPCHACIKKTIHILSSAMYARTGRTLMYGINANTKEGINNTKNIVRHPSACLRWNCS
jgi:hypothetical protein